MNPLIRRIADHTPAPLLDVAATIGSARLQRQRRSGRYRSELDLRRKWRSFPREQLVALQEKMTRDIVAHAAQHSPFYRDRFRRRSLSDLRELPVLEQEELRGKIDDIVIGDKRKLVKAFSGGTTGKGVVVYNDVSNLQVRWALLDLWWKDHGFVLGTAPIAWFSGRSLLGARDTKRGRFWRTNFVDKIRYYSTFHMTASHLHAYARDLCKFQPGFISGFPSAIGELARYIDSSGIDVPAVGAAFVTSETLHEESRAIIERVFKTHVRNQYSSSEGAPWIVECPEGSLHMDITTGVFEVVDDNGRPAREGEVLVTSFLMRETPLIRYRIGDRIKLSERGPCVCGWDTPLVDTISGRTTDYIEVPGRGRIFASQIGDCVKDVPSVIRFQVRMVDGGIHVQVVADQARFNGAEEHTFREKLVERVGDVPLDIQLVDEIPRAVSGKHSVIARLG